MNDIYWMVHNTTRSAPTIKHTSAQSAVTEARRLAELHPGDSVYILQAIGAFKASKPRARFLKLSKKT